MYHANLLASLALVFAANKPPVCWSIHHNNLSPLYNKKGTILVAKLGAWLSGFFPSVIICVSADVEARHAEAGYALGKMTVIENGIDTEAFRPMPEYNKPLHTLLGLDVHQKIIGYFGRYDPLKNQAGLIAAFGKWLADTGHNNVHLVMAGKDVDNTNQELYSVIEAYDMAGKVHLLGPRGDMPVMMNSIDLFFNASRGESFSLVLAEAMACGKPCVTTIEGDPSGMVPASWARIPADSLGEGFKWVNRFLFENGGSHQEHVPGRSDIVSRFSIDSTVAAYELLYKRYRITNF
jgi:glycosyltransferase involved in cell wall biosynthesis